MRKLSLLLALLLLLLPAAPFAVAETPGGFMAAHGLSEADAAAVTGMVEKVGRDLSEEEKRALFQAFVQGAASAAGAISPNIYSSPLGFSFQIPMGFECAENKLGATVLLTGPGNSAGFSTTIALQVFPGEQPLFDTLTPAQIEPLFKQTLPNYHFVSMDEFDYQGAKAREFVFVHGASEHAILMQYQMFFNREGKSYIITMTTLAEEAAHESALGIYDAFVSNLSFSGSQEGPAPQPGQTAEPGEPTEAPAEAPQGGVQGNG